MFWKKKKPQKAASDSGAFFVAPVSGSDIPTHPGKQAAPSPSHSHQHHSGDHSHSGGSHHSCSSHSCGGHSCGGGH
jgi:hypothetical protein